MPHIAKFHEDRKMDAKPQPARVSLPNSRSTGDLTEQVECPDCLCWEGRHRNGGCTVCGCTRTSLDD